MARRDVDKDEVVQCLATYFSQIDPQAPAFTATRFEEGKLYRRAEIIEAAAGRPVDWLYFIRPDAAESERAEQLLAIRRQSGLI